MDEKEILPFVEPIYHFCLSRCSNRCDAEDLSSEILCHILIGMKKYRIRTPEAWVWQIAHNRYARWLDRRSKERSILSGAELSDIEDSDYCRVDEGAVEAEYDTVFRCLHTLSAEYRNIFVDYYIGEMPVRQLSQKYALPETTIKWRLYDSRRKIRDRIGERKMDRVYSRINWNTTCCNGSMDADRYLHTQIARAICRAAYEMPLTIEELSLAAGIPAMYIEDELPRLEYGDAIRNIGGKYATNFIIYSLQNQAETKQASQHLIREIADCFEKILKGKISEEAAFYGGNFGVGRLGYIVIPYLLRRKIRDLKERLHMSSGSYPPRKDGGYGWFIVEETADENESCAEYMAGCNVAGDDSGSRNTDGGHIYYYWCSKYFENNIYHGGGTRWLMAKGIVRKCESGTVPEGLLSEDDIVRLLRVNLLVKDSGRYKLNFPCFTQEEFSAFTAAYEIQDKNMDKMISEWIVSVKRSFERFVPKRLHDQINQWISVYAGRLTGYTVEELIRRGVLEKPCVEIPLTNGVFYVEGDYINP